MGVGLCEFPGNLGILGSHFWRLGHLQGFLLTLAFCICSFMVRSLMKSAAIVMLLLVGGERLVVSCFRSRQQDES